MVALTAVAEFAEKLNADVCGATSVKLNAGFGSALLPPAVAAFEVKLNTPLAGCVRQTDEIMTIKLA